MIFLFPDINDCVDKPCVHGQCIDGIASYSCSCHPGWEGTDCEISEYLPISERLMLI